MAFTVGQLAEDCITRLEGTAHGEKNLLKVSLSASTPDAVDTLIPQFALGGIVGGVYLSIEDETLFVMSTNDSAGTASVLRGQKGSTAAAHSTPKVIEVDPPWPRWLVMSELQAEIRSWGPQVFQVAQADIPLANGILGYDLGLIAPVFRVMSVRMTAPGQIADVFSDLSQASAVAPNKEWPELEFEALLGNAPLTDFPSGSALILGTRNLSVPGVLHVTYAAPFDVDTSWTDTTDCINDVGLDQSDLDIPAYGVAARLLRYRTPRRLATQMQGQPRDAQEVPALALMQAADEFQRTRDQRLFDAQARLLTMFPMRMDFG